MNASRRLVAAVVIATLATLSAAAAIAASGSQAHAARRTLSLSGHVVGLYPGASHRMTILVRNRGRRPVRLRWITTHVGAANARCSGENVKVAPYHGRRRIAAGRSIHVNVAVLMKRGSPSGCQGGTFPLSFAVSQPRADVQETVSLRSIPACLWPGIEQ